MKHAIQHLIEGRHLAETEAAEVIFTSERTGGDNGCGEIAARMQELAAEQPGYLGVNSARDGLGITVS